MIHHPKDIPLFCIKIEDGTHKATRGDGVAHLKSFCGIATLTTVVARSPSTTKLN